MRKVRRWDNNMFHGYHFYKNTPKEIDTNFFLGFFE